MHFVDPRPWGDIIGYRFVLLAFFGWIKNILGDVPKSILDCVVASVMWLVGMRKFSFNLVLLNLNVKKNCIQFSYWKTFKQILT